MPKTNGIEKHYGKKLKRLNNKILLKVGSND